MKTSRLQYQYRQSASKLHKKVGNLLRSGETFIGIHEAYQEYPVNRVNSIYPNSSHHFDWVIPSLKVVIECHGEQHYSPVAFDGNYDTVVMKFEELKKRDKSKKMAALDADYVYIEVPYKVYNTIDEIWLLEAYRAGQEELKAHNSNRENNGSEEHKLVDKASFHRKVEARKYRKQYLASEKHQEDLRLAREYRKKRYKELKERIGK